MNASELPGANPHAFRIVQPARHDAQNDPANTFPESAFPPSPLDSEHYWESVRRGYQRLREMRVVITGLARDVASVLPQTIARVDRTCALFADSRVVIYENDSQDETLPMLKQWAARRSEVTILTETRSDPVNPTARCLSRAQRMAYYRNQCQRYVADTFPEFDCVILLDTDVIGGWSDDGIAQSFSRDDWDFVGANGMIYRREGRRPNTTVQYDAWAYREDDAFTPWTTRQVNQLHFQRGAPWHPVTSCFGGLGIYTLEAYSQGNYNGEDIEHVGFHRDLRKKGFARMYLNPSQIVLYGRKHRSWDRLVSRMMRLTGSLSGRDAVDWQYPHPRMPRMRSDRRANRVA